MRHVSYQYDNDATNLLQYFLNAYRPDLIEEQLKGASSADVVITFGDSDLRMEAFVIDRTLADEDGEEYDEADLLDLGELPKERFYFPVCGVYGHEFAFLAFCLQEHELLPKVARIPGYHFEGGYDYDKQGAQIENVHVNRSDGDTGGIDLSEWREYIKNKYDILPPKLDGWFPMLLDVLIVTGGIVID